MPVLEFSALEDYVVLRKTDDASPWLSQGYTPVEPAFIAFHAALAVGKVERQQLDRLLFELTLEPVPRDADAFELEVRLGKALSPFWFVMLRRPIERPGSLYEIPKLLEPVGPRRLDTEHYVLIEAMDEGGAPVRGVRLELVIAGGEVRRATTDNDGIARVERIQAGRVVIRVLDMDGSMWRALEGDASQPSTQEAGIRWHEVRAGECLSRIAHRYGIRGWKQVWGHPRNEPLRKKRKSPHVLNPGDLVAVPGVQVHELVRATDATHRIQVERGATVKVRLRLQDLAREPFSSLSYDCAFRQGEVRVQKPGSSPTDAEGWLEEQVPVGVDELLVTLHKPRLRFALRLGALDPVQDEETGEPMVAGVHVRLSALGYAPGPLESERSARARQAVSAFQADELDEQRPTGELDDRTIRALERAYGV